MKTCVHFGSLVLSVLIPVSVAAQEPGVRIAGLSPQRVFAESPQGKAGMAQLATLKDKQAREIAAKNQALESQERALQETGGLLSEEVRTQRTKEVEKFRIDVRRFIEDAQADLLGAQRDVEGAFLVKLRPAVEQVAKAKGLQFVVNLDADTVVWADRAVDITDDVVKQLARAQAPRP